MVRFLPLAIVALPSVLGIGCSESLGFDPIVACSDSQTVTVQVTASVTPRFNWAPACGMASLQVFLDSGSAGRWIVYSGSAAPENPLPSGIRYGQLPPKGVAPDGAQPLSSGVSYRVVVYRWVGAAGGPGSLFERGSATFTQ
jgi:hypothetical protein